MATLRIGVLGAARITPAALIKPARRVDEVEVVAVAARDRSKAEVYAKKHNIRTVHGSYDELIADPAVDAIYNPLPNGLHGRWTIAALEAGKHVLCEKPFTANADEARTVAAVAERTGLVCMEAFHYRYHPLAKRLIEIVDSGELGTIERVEAWMCIPLLPAKDIRWNLALAGGTTMDVGCYALHMIRSFSGEEPSVRSAVAKERSPGVDRRMTAELDLPSGASAKVDVSMLSMRLLALGARVTGSDGEVRVINATAPQYFHRFSVRSARGRRRERFSKDPSYLFQLRAFAGAALRGEPIVTGPTDSIANMEIIDAVYRAAGMEPRRAS
ncbi:MAG: Gfo/Idh/MocA family protein [Acidimicrobiales bacterium]